MTHSKSIVVLSHVRNTYGLMLVRISHVRANESQRVRERARSRACYNEQDAIVITNLWWRSYTSWQLSYGKVSCSLYNDFYRISEKLWVQIQSVFIRSSMFLVSLSPRRDGKLRVRLYEDLAKLASSSVHRKTFTTFKCYDIDSLVNCSSEEGPITSPQRLEYHAPMIQTMLQKWLDLPLLSMIFPPNRITH